MSSSARKTQNKHTYGDYAKWPDEQRWELIEGIPHAMTAPSRAHQKVSGKLEWQIESFLVENETSCEMYHAPFDVRLPEKDDMEDKDIATVVQPDILVTCDPNKLDDRGMKGAPDFIIEIISPFSAGRDQIKKLYLYEKHKVREYWLVHPLDKIVRVYLLGEDDEYGVSRCYDKTDEIAVRTLPGLTINLAGVFDAEQAADI